MDKYSQKTSSGKVFTDFEPNVNKSFNRGFTDYFLEKRGKIYNFETPKSIGEKIGKIEFVGKNYFVIKNHNLHAQDGLYFDGQGCLVNKIDEDKIYPNNMNGIKTDLTVYRNQDVEFEKKLKTSKTKRQISVNIEIFADKITVIDENKNEISIEIIAEEFAQNQEKMAENFKKQLQKTGESDFYCASIGIKSDKLPFLPISKINELRKNLFKNLMEERIKNYAKTVQKPLKYTQYPLKELGFNANVHNKYAKEFYEKCGCKILEKSIESGTSIREKPVMTTKHCLKYAFNMCKKPVELYLIDEKQKKYKLKFDCQNCQMQIFVD